MTTYATTPPNEYVGYKVTRTPNLGSVTITLVNLSGVTGAITTGPGGTDPVLYAVGYLWPRGDGTPAGT